MRRRHQRNSCRFRPFRSLFVGPALGSRSAKRHENNCRLTVLSVADNRGPFVPAVTVAEILRSARLSAVDVCSGREMGYGGEGAMLGIRFSESAWSNTSSYTSV